MTVEPCIPALKDTGLRGTCLFMNHAVLNMANGLQQSLNALVRRDFLCCSKFTHLMVVAPVHLHMDVPVSVESFGDLSYLQRLPALRFQCGMGKW